MRWAHLALTSEYVDKVGLNVNFMHAKLQYEMESCIKRHERLEGEDHYEQSLAGDKPRVQGKDGGTLYIESKN